MKAYARGFSGLNDSRFDVGAALLGQRVLPGKATASVLDISRVNELVLGARLRGGERPDPLTGESDKDFREAAERGQTLRDLVAAGHPPADWVTFFRLVTDVEADRHDGTMGWADEAWYAPVTRFLDQQRAPEACRAAFRFLHAIATYDWPAAADQVDLLLRARADGIAWLNNDLLRDGAVVALLHTNHVTRARTAFDKLAEYAARKPEDLRVRMLDAHIAQREKAR